MIYNIAIIGAGQLGSRHLQGLKKANIEMSIFVVDTNTQSLKVSKERYEGVESAFHVKSIDYLMDIDFLPSQLDLVIIATNSIPRADLTKHLLNSKKVTYIVFEKFLFPSISDYLTIGKLLLDNNIKAWVNCPRRYFSFYKDLKKLLVGSLTIDMHLSGPDWGLACNSIHFIDLFAMLSEKQDFEVDTSMLEKIIDSKRPGYIELIGTIDGKSVSGNYHFSLTSQNNCNSFSIHISTEKYLITIFESQKKAYIETEDSEEIEKEVKINYQSELTGIIAEQILLNGFSELTPYNESANLHIQFLEPVINYYNQKTGKNQDFCPIT